MTNYLSYEVFEYLASEMTEVEILDDFPDLTPEDLKACIAYAAERERRLMIVNSHNIVTRI